MVIQSCNKRNFSVYLEFLLIPRQSTPLYLFSFYFKSISLNLFLSALYGDNVADRYKSLGLTTGFSLLLHHLLG